MNYFCKKNALKASSLVKIYASSPEITQLTAILKSRENRKIRLQGLSGSALGFIAMAAFKTNTSHFLFIISDKEDAAYFFNDLENISESKTREEERKKVIFFPSSYRRPYESEKTDNANVLQRNECINRLCNSTSPLIIVTYPEALSEKVVTKKELIKNTLKLKKNEKVSMDFISELLLELNFERVDFVAEPGQYALRGGIADVFSYSDGYPCRIEFFGDTVESLRTFDPATQLSVKEKDEITILPDLHKISQISLESFLHLLPSGTVIWTEDIPFAVDKIDQDLQKAEKAFSNQNNTVSHLLPEELYLKGSEFAEALSHFRVIETGFKNYYRNRETIPFQISPQPHFNKNFDLFFTNLVDLAEKSYTNYIFSDNPKQLDRLNNIVADLKKKGGVSDFELFQSVDFSISKGFIDHGLKISCYTDHQIFERYHRYTLKDSFSTREAFTLKDIYSLKPGDYITHIYHGVGIFGGLEKIFNNGREQEALRIVFKDNDLLYVSIHSLHRISKYVGKEGTAPVLDRLGSASWARIKEKTKKRVKDIARDLIALYAKRKAAEGFSFSPDTYLQYELEASFIYEDTPDQVKSTADIKKDMEAGYPMDRLVCGDVGFGKTEVAIRAAFKAVSDSKQVAILVPTTVLALQHYRTFSERLREFPCNIDYLNRFKSGTQQKKTIEQLKTGKADIIIGTHRLLSKDITFKDLGLLIIDEEQKFGVAAKEKIKQMKVNVDTLTLSATPIPRTLQFSLMGARDMSIINTPPPNRFPVQTELHSFDEEIIRDAIRYEMKRGGQVFFVHNRIQNIMEVEGIIKRLVPDARVTVCHGQMDGDILEKEMLAFIDGEYDILLATTIIENGLDIPNANTIIINEAQHYGLSDLHQLRGRVGRANRKAFCYLLSPPLAALTDEARKRLKAIEEFSDIGSGFNIAMRDLDIRGAGNLLGSEQSGFISEIGYDMYQKILDEAIRELKQTEFKELFKDEMEEQPVSDCTIETDLELLIPDDYISNITERLILYKELDSLETEEELAVFEKKLTDRFGKLPKQTTDLIHAIRMRRLASRMGFEKLFLKQGRMVAYFTSDQDSAYFQSASFTRVLNYLKTNPSKCWMKESTNKLTLTFGQIHDVRDAIAALHEIGEN